MLLISSLSNLTFPLIYTIPLKMSPAVRRHLKARRERSCGKTSRRDSWTATRLCLGTAGVHSRNHFASFGQNAFSLFKNQNLFPNGILDDSNHSFTCSINVYEWEAVFFTSACFTAGQTLSAGCFNPFAFEFSSFLFYLGNSYSFRSQLKCHFFKDTFPDKAEFLKSYLYSISAVPVTSAVLPVCMNPLTAPQRQGQPCLPLLTVLYSTPSMVCSTW